MKLHVENFAKISIADILFDGLTVIAGDNNTGKSTIGKILYSFFRGQSDIERRVKDARLESIREAFRQIVPAEIDLQTCEAVLEGKQNPTSVLSDLLANNDVAEDLSSGPIRISIDASSVLSSFADKLSSKVEQIRTMPFERVSWNIFRRVLECVFHGQYHPLKSDERPAIVDLQISGDSNKIVFFHDRAELDRPTRLYARAQLVKTPDVLDLLNIRGLEQASTLSKALGKETYELAVELVKEKKPETVINEVGRKDLIDSIVKELDGVCGRTALTKDDHGDFVLTETGNTIPTKAENLSSGLKAFVLLRTMLESRVLSERDVLILDEPENHLHPAWQVAYAKLLILLQKAFDLRLLVTTHSQFFVSALQRFVISEGVADKTHFYMSRQDETRPGYCTFDDLKQFASSIMVSFNRAYDDISNLSGEFAQDSEEALSE